MKPKEFFTNLLEDLCDYDDALKAYIITKNSNFLSELTEDTRDRFQISTAFGISRFAIIPERYNWILKMDVSQDGYCYKELDYYSKAREIGLEKFFVEPKYEGTFTYTFTENFSKEDFLEEWYKDKDINQIFNKLRSSSSEKEVNFNFSIPIIVYRKVECGVDNFVLPYEAEMKNYVETYREQVSSKNSPLFYTSKVVAFLFANFYTNDEFDELSKFLEEYNINDLHTGNIGSFNGRVVIIDYAGYESSGEYYSPHYYSSISKE